MDFIDYIDYQNLQQYFVKSQNPIKIFQKQSKFKSFLIFEHFSLQINQMQRKLQQLRRSQIPLDPQVWKKINKQIKLQDLYHLMYLKPLELKLDEQPGGLPKGLLVYDRQTDTNIKVKTEELLSYQQFLNKKSTKDKGIHDKFPTYLQYIQDIHADNLLYQLKAHTQIQMAICICMYNEDRAMLQNTLQGVGENIVKLYKQGIDPDKIIVVIIQDGIQKMDQSILSLFQILQLQSGIRFSADYEQLLEQKLKKLEQIQTSRQNQHLLQEDNIVNMDTFLFTPEQLQKRKLLRFITVKNQYNEVKKIQKDVQSLKKKKNITSQDLSLKVYDFYLRLCYADYIGKKQNQLKDVLPKNAQNIVQEHYNQDLKKSKPFIQDALTKTKKFCENYIKQRSNIAHTSFFRTSMFFPDEIKKEQEKLLKKNNKNKNKKQYIQEQMQNLHKKSIKQAIKMNIFFVVKYKNAQKLSSHNWFFNGFCKQFGNIYQQTPTGENLSPKFTILLDVGLRPDSVALVKMYNVLNNHPEIGGVCGYMGLKIEKADEQTHENLDFFTQIFQNVVDIQRAQQMEYHFAHLIDKGFESIFKFIHVLPGAFSGYNMKAIWGQDESNADLLLLDYFSSISDKLSVKKYADLDLSPLKIVGRVLLPNFLVKSRFITSPKQTHENLMYSSNVNLAQDRILCMGIYKNHKKLIFLPDAYSFVDPVKDLPGLMGQRKRWINGSFFAFDKVSDQFSQQEGCCHILNFQINYLAFMNILAFIAPGFFLFTLSIAMQAFKADVLIRFFQKDLTPTSNIYGAFVYTINFIYVLLLGGLVFYSMSLNNRNKQLIRYVYSLSTLLGIISLIIFVILLVDLIRGLTSSRSFLINNMQFVSEIPGGILLVDILRYIVMGTVGLYALPVMVYCLLFCNGRIIFQVLAGVLSFIFYQPTYLIILNTYALCRMDDLSWGTKGLQSGESNKDNQILTTWKIIRTIHVGKYVFWNIVVAGLLIHYGSNYLFRFYLTFALIGLITSTFLIKVILALTYFLYYKCCINTKPKRTQTPTQVVPCLFKNFNSSTGITNLDEQLREMIKKNIINLQRMTNVRFEGHSIMAIQVLGMSMKPIRRQQQNRSLNPIQKVIKNIDNMLKKKSIIINKRKSFKKQNTKYAKSKEQLNQIGSSKNLLENHQLDKDTPINYPQKNKFKKNLQI